MMMLKITEEEAAKVADLLHDSYEMFFQVKVRLNKDDQRAMWQTHPQVDKKAFNSDDVIGLKNPDKPFPVSKY